MKDDIETRKDITELVTRVYRHLLCREPDERELMNYVNSVFTGNIDIRYIRDYDSKINDSSVNKSKKLIRRKSLVDLSKIRQIYHRDIRNVLIGITTYQCLDDTKKTIGSIKTQDIYSDIYSDTSPSASTDKKYKIDILVVDNCSTDGSLEYFNQNNIDHILLEGRKCVAAAWNKCLEKVYDYDCVIILNNDVILERDYIRKLINDFTQYSDNCIFMNGVANNSGSGIGDTRLESFDDLIISGDFSAFIVDRHTVEKVGYFDERYIRLIDDNDYAHRIHLSGNKCIRNHRCKFGHVSGNTYKHNIDDNRNIPNLARKSLILYKDKWGNLPKGSQGLANLGGVTGKLTGGDLGYEGIYDYIKGFDTAVIMILGRFGDTLTALPVAKWYHNRGKRVVWYTSELYSDFFKKISYIDEVVSVPKVLNSNGNDVNWVESFWGASWNNAMKDIEIKDVKYIESKYGDSFGSGMRGFITPSINPLYAKEYDKCDIPFLQFMMILGGIDPYDKKNFNRETLFPDLSDYVPNEINRHRKDRCEDINVKKIGLALTGWSVSIPFKEGYIDSLCKLLVDAGYELYNLSLEKINSRYINNSIAKPFIEMPKIVNDMDFIISIPTSIHEISISLGIPSVFVITNVNGRINKKFSMTDQKIDILMNTVDYWYSQDKNPGELANIVLDRIERITKG